MRELNFGKNKEVAQGYMASQWQNRDSTSSCDLQFLCFSVPSDNHFMTIDSEALDWALRIQVCRKESLLVDLSVLGEMDTQETGCLILRDSDFLSNSDKSYGGKAQDALGTQTGPSGTASQGQ